MSDQPYYVINRNPKGGDVLHRNPREECNQDDADGRQKVDPSTGKALEKSGHIRLCGHCYNTEEPT